MQLNNDIWYTDSNPVDDIKVGVNLNTIEGLQLNMPWDVTNVYCSNKHCAGLLSGYTDSNMGIQTTNGNAVPGAFEYFDKGKNFRNNIRWMYKTTNENVVLGSITKWGNNVTEFPTDDYYGLNTYKPITYFNINKLIGVVYVIIMRIQKSDNKYYRVGAIPFDTYTTDYADLKDTGIYEDDSNYYIAAGFFVQWYYGDASARYTVPIVPVVEVYDNLHDAIYYCTPITKNATNDSDYNIINILSSSTFTNSRNQSNMQGNFNYFKTAPLMMYNNGTNVIFPGDFPEFDLTFDHDNVIIHKTNLAHDNCGVILVPSPYSTSYTFLWSFYSRDYIERAVSGLGVYWTGNTSSAFASPLGKDCFDGLVRLGVMDDEGVTDGTFVTGTEIQEQRQADFDNYTDTPWENKYDPNKDLVTDETPLITPNLTPINNFTTYYALTNTELNNFANFLWNTDSSIYEEIVNGLKLMGENPINGVVSARLYPFNILDRCTYTTSNITIGRTDTGINAKRILTYHAVIDMGSAVFTPKFDNFLDYSPYTNIVLYLPYCGTIEIAPEDVIGKEVSVKYIVDITTGTCTACVYFGGIAYAFKQGVIGVDIPITGDNAVQVANNYISGALGLAGTAVGASSAKTAQSAIGAGLDVLAGVNNLAQFGATSFQSTGANSPSCANWQPQNCYFITSRPITDIPDNYGHTVGYVTNKTFTLNELSGYTICSNVDISGIYGTDEEKDMIKTLLESGVYL